MKNQYNFDSTKISSLCIDGTYLWLGFLGSDNSTYLKKVEVLNPDSIYFNVPVEVNDIINLVVDDNYVYGIDSSATKLFFTTLKLNPYSYITYINKPVGINEDAIDFVMDTDYIYILISGLTSGNNAKILKYNRTTWAYIETIDLTTVFNANKISQDENGHLWVISEIDPPILTEVYLTSGDVWNFTSYTLS